MKLFPGRVGLQQRVLPSYRAAFFDALAAACQGGLSVFAGEPRSKEAIQTTDKLDIAQLSPAENRHFLNGSLYMCWQPGILDWLEQWQPDALIVEANARYPSTRKAVKWMHDRDRPVVGWGLGAPAIRGPIGVLRRFTRRKFLHSLDRFIAYSRKGADEYRELGLEPQRIFVAPNAVAMRPTQQPPTRPPKFHGQPKLLFVGRLQHRKRVDNLIRACASLPEELAPRLMIVGDGPAREDLEIIAQEIYPNTEFLGARHGAELAELFKTADLFVLPGTGGLAIQEAMSFGLPVVVAQGDGTQADLVRPENGWLVPNDDLESLISAMHTALSDPARLRKMGKESLRIAMEEVNIETMATVFISVLGSLHNEA